MPDDTPIPQTRDLSWEELVRLAEKAGEDSKRKSGRAA